MVQRPWSLLPFFPQLLMLTTWFVFHSVGSSIVTSLQVIQLKCIVIMTVCLFYLWPNCCALYQNSTSLIFNMIDIMTTLPNNSRVKARMITPTATRPRHHWKRRLNNNSILMTDARTKRDRRGKQPKESILYNRIWARWRRECESTYRGDWISHVSIRQVCVSKPIKRFRLPERHQHSMTHRSYWSNLCVLQKWTHTITLHK